MIHQHHLIGDAQFKGVGIWPRPAVTRQRKEKHRHRSMELSHRLQIGFGDKEKSFATGFASGLGEKNFGAVRRQQNVVASLQNRSQRLSNGERLARAIDRQLQLALDFAEADLTL